MLDSSRENWNISRNNWEACTSIVNVFTLNCVSNHTAKDLNLELPEVGEDVVDVALIVVVVSVSKLFCPETLRMKNERNSFKWKKYVWN